MFQIFPPLFLFGFLVSLASCVQTQPPNSGAKGAAATRRSFPPGTRFGLVCITFDRSGRVDTAVWVKHLGSEMLERTTVTYARNHWHGPPLTSQNIPITYSLTSQPKA